MKTRLIWKNCPQNDNKDSYWVECTDSDVQDKILPHIKDDIDHIKEEINKNRGVSLIHKEEVNILNFFLISCDLAHIKSYSWLMPHSSLWNAYCPFKEFDEIALDSLEDLKKLVKE